MRIETRHAHHPETARAFDTAALRRHFLIEQVFVPGEIALTYSHLDRMVVGGAMPIAEPLSLPAPKAVGTDSFLARRELGILNIGGPGRVRTAASSHDLQRRDGLYLGQGQRDVTFESMDSVDPAKFYLLSTPAHRAFETVEIPVSKALTQPLGDLATANRRTLFQYFHPDVLSTAQLVMGMTQLDTGNVWNTMPSHVHDRRSEVYLYFDMAPTTRIFHMMGEPNETRHIVMANEQAVLSPPWSIHSGVGTSSYAFIWGMGGDNIDYRDMDAVPMEMLR